MDFQNKKMMIFRKRPVEKQLISFLMFVFHSSSLKK